MRFPQSAKSISNASWDVVVIGAGAAGLMTCLEMPSNLKVLLLNRNTSRHSSSRWAQGGIAAVTRAEDSVESHAEDTFKAGAGLCDSDAVSMFVRNAPKCVERLESLGMDFDRDGDKLATTLEAAHACRRVLHVQDRTGRALVEVLQDQVERRKNLFHFRGVRVTQLLIDSGQCKGVQILDGPYLYWIFARAVVLATGGGGHLFANTTNPSQACGEGLALAWRAGAVVQDLEFFQFHPTALKLDGAPCFLISEALRGEGAILLDGEGNSPVAHLDGKDLAPRDKVSRALAQAMKNKNIDHLELDLKNISPAHMGARFPSILQRCIELGLDPLKKPIPVAPAAHYWMGGVATDLYAQTSVKGLYAVGEVASTGLHGANRLASNSLMECLVFARQMAEIELPNYCSDIQSGINKIPIESSLGLSGINNEKQLLAEINKLRELCWLEAGVNRSAKGMQIACNLIKSDAERISNEPLIELVENQSSNSFYSFTDNSRRHLNLLLDLKNRQLTTMLLLQACLFRKESRGGHFRIDSPKTQKFWECHTLQKKGLGLFTRPVKY